MIAIKAIPTGRDLSEKERVVGEQSWPATVDQLRLIALKADSRRADRLPLRLQPNGARVKGRRRGSGSYQELANSENITSSRVDLRQQTAPIVCGGTGGEGLPDIAMG